MVLDSREAVLGYARRFVEAGCPVILLKASNDPSGEFRFPSGWDSATPGQAWADVEAGFESGQDALALVSGWGVDGADFDAKLAGAVDTFGERGLAFLALHRTPSGGLHYIVPATGMASRNGVDFDGRPFGDWRGGTDSGGGRGLLFLPGSTRPKYPGGEYTVEVEFTGLPEDAEPAVQRAFAALKDRKHPQAQILRVLNMELEALGAKPISKSAFNRKALWLASYGRQLEQAREIASVWAERLDETPDGDVGLLLGETLKTLIFDVLTETTLSAQSPSMVMLGVASEALRNLEKARELSVTTRVKIERDFIKDAKKAVDRVAKEKGLSKDTISAIKSQILGVRAAA